MKYVDVTKKFVRKGAESLPGSLSLEKFWIEEVYNNVSPGIRLGLFEKEPLKRLSRSLRRLFFERRKEDENS